MWMLAFLLLFISIVFLFGRIIRGIVIQQKFRFFAVIIAVTVLIITFFLVEIFHGFMHSGDEEPTTAPPTATVQIK